MPKVRYNAEEVIHKLGEADVLPGQGNTVSQVGKRIGVTEPIYYRWRRHWLRILLLHDSQCRFSVDLPGSLKWIFAAVTGDHMRT